MEPKGDNEGPEGAALVHGEIKSLLAQIKLGAYKNDGEGVMGFGYGFHDLADASKIVK